MKIDQDIFTYWYVIQIYIVRHSFDTSIQAQVQVVNGFSHIHKGVKRYWKADCLKLDNSFRDFRHFYLSYRNDTPIKMFRI